MIQKFAFILYLQLQFVIFILFPSFIFFVNFPVTEDDDFEPVPVGLPTNPAKNKWDDEDVDDENVKESWEDEDESVQVKYSVLGIKILNFGPTGQNILFIPVR